MSNLQRKKNENQFKLTLFSITKKKSNLIKNIWDFFLYIFREVPKEQTFINSTIINRDGYCKCGNS